MVSHVSNCGNFGLGVQGLDQAFLTLAQNMLGYVIQYDLLGNLVYMNSQMERLTGLDLQTVIGKKCTDVFTSIFFNLEDLQTEYWRVVETRVPMCVAIKIKLSAGYFESVNFTLIPVLDQGGDFVSILCIGENTMHSQMIKQEVFEKESQLKLIAENITDYIIQVDTVGNILYVNTRLQQSLLAPALRKGNNIFEALSEEKIPTIKSSHDALRHVIKTGVTLEKELYPRPNGTPQIHRVKYIPELSEDGNVRSVLIVGVNITDQRKLEDELRQSELEFRSLADNFPYIIVRYDLEFRRKYVNHAFEKLTGVTANTVLNERVEDVWLFKGSLMMQDFKAHLEKVKETNLPHEFFAKWSNDVGETNHIEIILVPEINENDDLQCILAIGHNTNTYEKAMQELKDLNRKLQILSATRESAREEERKYIAQEIHDELGQLLSVLHMNASTLDYLYGPTNPDLRQRAASMMSISDTAIQTVRQVVTQLRPAILTNGLVYALEDLLEDFETNSGLSVKLDINSPKIDIGEDRAAIFFRIVQEALTNIIRHANATLVTINVMVSGENIHLLIQDNGKGFVCNQIKKDHGFGLLGMQERVVALQGIFEINSKPNQGTVIKIQVPSKPTMVHKRRHDD